MSAYIHKHINNIIKVCLWDLERERDRKSEKERRREINNKMKRKIFRKKSFFLAVKKFQNIRVLSILGSITSKLPQRLSKTGTRATATTTKSYVLKIALYKIKETKLMQYSFFLNKKKLLFLYFFYFYSFYFSKASVLLSSLFFKAQKKNKKIKREHLKPSPFLFCFCFTRIGNYANDLN